MTSTLLDEFKSDLVKLGNVVVEKSIIKNVTLIFTGSISSYLVFKSVKFWLKKRKFRHIPGPPTEG